MLFNPNSMNTEVLNQGHELLSAWLLYSRKSGGTAAHCQDGRPRVWQTSVCVPFCLGLWLPFGDLKPEWLRGPSCALSCYRIGL